MPIIVTDEETLRTLIAEAVRDALPTATVATTATGLSRTETAKAIRRSLPTLDRACRQGLPFRYVGSRRVFDLAEVTAWFAARGKKATTAESDPDVAAMATKAGLRRVA